MKAKNAKPQGAAMVLETLDGRAYLGNSPVECLRAMRRAAWGCEALTMRGYMEGVAARVRNWCKLEIRHETPAELIADLEAAGIVTLSRVN